MLYSNLTHAEEKRFAAYQVLADMHADALSDLYLASERVPKLESIGAEAWLIDEAQDEVTLITKIAKEAEFAADAAYEAIW